MSALELRAAGLFETELLGELHARCFAAPWDESWSAASFAEILRHAGITALIAVSGGEPVGFGLTLKAADEVELLFAGGIHDARSSAMLQVLVAPLVAAGAKVGILMGSAYLFTQEIVSSGAIVAQFQQEEIGRASCRERV